MALNSHGMNHRTSIGIASYNIHSGYGLDGKRKSSRIAHVLTELDCDLYALQEVDNQPGAHEESMQLEYFARKLQMTAVPGLRIVRHTGEYGNAILTRLPVLDVRRHDLSVSRYEPRGAIDVLVQVNDRPLRVIATHLGLRSSERRQQWQRLIAALNESDLLNIPTILLGDMNEWHPRAGMLAVLDRLLGKAPALKAFPAFAPCLSLTRVWTRPQTSLLSLQVHRSKTARAASDHLPVKAMIDASQ